MRNSRYISIAEYIIQNINIYILYFWSIRCTPQIWEEKGGASYSPNVAYLAPGVGRGGGGAGFLFPYFLPLKPRCVFWFGTSYSLKNMVYISLLHGR